LLLAGLNFFDYKKELHLLTLRSGHRKLRPVFRRLWWWWWWW